MSANLAARLIHLPDIWPSDEEVEVMLTPGTIHGRRVCKTLQPIFEGPEAWRRMRWVAPEHVALAQASTPHPSATVPPVREMPGLGGGIRRGCAVVALMLSGSVTADHTVTRGSDSG